MKIVHVVVPARYGGLEEVLQRLSRGQDRAGHEVCVCAVLPETGSTHPFVEALRGGDLEVRTIRPGPRGYFRERRAVAAACRDFSATVVHTHGYRADVVDGLYAHRDGFPVVSTVHGYTGGGWKNRLYERLQRRALRKFDGVVAVSRPLARSLIDSGIATARVWTIPNGWIRRSDVLTRPAARERLNVDADAFLVGWVGRLSHEKGPDVVLDAFAELEDPGIALALIGSGPMGDELRRRAEARGTSGRIRWTGELTNAAEVYSAFDVFVLSSRTEGTPMVLFEAVEAGIPIVATDVGGVSDVVTSEEALLVPPGHPSAIAEAVERTRQHPNRARARTAAARSRIRERFGIEEWVRRYDEVYRSVVEG